ncbi:MAG: hypothetical protein AAF492_22215, partial [Verrucomicrobiota bacterium]
SARCTRPRTKKKNAAPPVATELIHDTDDALTIHGLNITLSQANLPYTIHPEKKLASARDFAVYADTITLTENLTNPGRNIRLCAREIILENPTVIDVSGADADHDYRPDQPADQDDLSPAAPGAHGEDGTDAGDSGHIFIAAERILNRVDRDQFNALRLNDNQTQMQAAFAEVTAAFKSKGGTISAPAADFQFAYVTEFFGQKVETKADLKGNKVSDLRKLQFEEVKVDGADMVAHLSMTDLTLSGKDAATSYSVTSKPFTLSLLLECQRDSRTGQLKVIATQLDVDSVHFAMKAFSGTVDVSLNLAARNKLRKALEKPIGEKISTPLIEQINAALPSSALSLLAQGGRGGRGQDGHAGIRGPKGEDGVELGLENMGSDMMGIVSWPDKATGKNGRKGGKAGNAGKSGGGGKGGSVALELLNDEQIHILYSVDGGPGGEAAKPGLRGPGGRGGDGKLCYLTVMEREHVA